MWGPCFGHKRAIFWPFLGKRDYGIHPELWNFTLSLPGHIDYDSGRTIVKDHVKTFFWPWNGHILAIFRKRGWWDTPRSVKFGMEHPCAHWLWFRKTNSKDHVRIMFWTEKGPYFGHFPEKRTMGCTQSCEILHGPSLGILIIIQEEPILRTIWGLCFGHKRAIFWPFLGEGDHGIHPVLWNLACSLPGHIDYDSGKTNLTDHVRTIFCP